MKKITVDAQRLVTRYNVTEIGQGLPLYMENLNRGRTMTPRSWLYEHRDAKAVLSEWQDIMEKANLAHPLGEEFNMFDLKQVEKFGPQGGIPPINSEECKDAIEPMYTSSTYDDPLALQEWFPKAHEFGKALFAHPLRGRPLPYESVVDGMRRRDTLTTNSGFPNFTKRMKTVELEIAYASSLKAWRFPAIVLFRYYYGKLRPVWMFPMATNLIEASFQVPLQSSIQLSPLVNPTGAAAYVTPWAGFTYVKQQIAADFEEWEGTLLGGDTTKMDAHMRPAQLKLVFEIVKWYFQKQYWDELERSLMHVTDIDLLWAKHGDRYTIVTGTHGLASGSNWTQISETVLQLFMAWTLGVDGQGIGDDFYWLADMGADALVEYLDKFGLPANPAKQSVSEEHLTFLQRYFHREFDSTDSPGAAGAYYPTIRALGSMLYPEKWHNPKDWDSDMFCVRNYMILENCVDDPCFEQFVKFVAAGQRDMIPFAKKARANKDHFADKVEAKARLLPGLWPSYNQEKLDQPLWSFSSIALAARL